ncbi:MAG: AzlC family ABC transporter permease [Gemmiger sp.]
MREFRFAARQTVPVLCGYMFLGIAFGLVLHQAGYGWGWALAMSLFVYAGSLQFVLAGMLGSAGLLSTALTALSVNSRHLFYGLSFLEKFRAMDRARPYMIFSLTDETYSLLCSVQTPEGMDENRVLFFISLLDQIYWMAGSVLGAVLGNVLPFDLTGIDFAMTALFVVIFLEQWLNASSRLPAVIGLAFGLLSLALFGPQRFLLPALIATVLALCVCRPAVETKQKEVQP